MATLPDLVRLQSKLRELSLLVEDLVQRVTPSPTPKPSSSPAQRSRDNKDNSTCGITSTPAEMPLESLQVDIASGVASTVFPLPPSTMHDGAAAGADGRREGRPSKRLIAGSNRHPNGASWRIRRASRHVSCTKAARWGAFPSPTGPDEALLMRHYMLTATIFDHSHAATRINRHNVLFLNCVTHF